MISRRVVITGAATGSLLWAAGCAVAPPPPSGPDETPAADPKRHQVIARTPDADLVISSDAAAALSASRALLSVATAVVVVARPDPDAEQTATPTTLPGEIPPGATTSAAPAAPATFDELLATASGVARELGIPLFVAEPDTADALASEIARLQTRTVLAYPADAMAATGTIEVVAGPATASEVSLDGLPMHAEAPPVLPLSAVEVSVPLTTTLAAAGLTVTPIRWPHPGVDGASTAAVRANTGVVVGIGEGFGTDAQFAGQVRATRTADEFPSGGIAPFPAHCMVALYGHPEGPALGMLGEQSPAKSVERVKKLVAEYQALLPDEHVMGAFEIIATVASASAGDDGDYSRETPIDALLPLIDAAEENDIYVVLDLQPGRTDFLTQAKLYEELLKRPHVGLALDPEWRLKPNQRHLRQIGQVGVDEVNEVGTWLADLVAAHDLPPKVLTLHQFQTRMIVDRQRLDVSRPEIQYLVHVDGQGAQGAKQGTWSVIKKDLPERVWVGWKNFEDEDIPMLTVAQTVAQVHPTPRFISYQ